MNQKVSIIITSFNEPETIKKAISSILVPNEDIWNSMELIVVAPDSPTLDNTTDELRKYSKFTNFIVLKDKGVGKPAALNLAIEKASNEILILTDGDVYLNDIAVKSLYKHFANTKVGGVSGQPTSTSDNSTRFGFYSNVFCTAAHQKRLTNDYVHMSGYVYAIRNFKNLLPIPTEVRSEDAYISMWLKSKGYTIEYEPEAKAYVKFPTNFKDWMNQKVRSLGGAIQLKKYMDRFEDESNSDEMDKSLSNQTDSKTNESDSPKNGNPNQNKRNMTQDLHMVFFPLQYASNFKEYYYALTLYPLRLWLWIVVYYNHITGKYEDGMWKRIESTK